MAFAVAAHLGVAALLPLFARRLGARVYLLAAVVPAAVFGWLLAAQLGDVRAGGRPAEVLSWAPQLHLTAAFRLDPLAVLMALLVTGVGALVLCYARWYHAHDTAGLGRSASALLAFAGAMLGLVLADDLLTLYVFWELTTVFSFVLIGGDGVAPAARRSAVQALLVTTVGGLAMLFGFVLLGQAAGTYRISGIVAHPPPAGGIAAAAAPLILLGAATKSAQAPFHPWLPAAMVAPTPVSAYLHAAAMVKAGVFLVAALTPAFAAAGGFAAVWTVPAAVLGAATMLIGGLRALAATDLKQLLAFGTVSQLGMLIALVGVGGRTVALAGVTLILAHALFKAALFMVVGIVDHRAGERDLRRLSGLGRQAPVLLTAAALAGASMAALPPTVGFLGKEAALEGLWEGPGAGWAVLLGVMVVGASLTMGYTIRFVWGAFATKPGVAPSGWRPASPAFTGPVMLLAAAGLGLGAAAPAVDDLLAGYADTLPSGGNATYHLALWHGVGAALLLTAIAAAAGVAVFLAEPRLAAARAAVAAARAGRKRAGITPTDATPTDATPTAVRTWARVRGGFDAQRAYERTVTGVGRLALAVTARTQVGSLPMYLATLLIVALLVPGAALAHGLVWPTDLPGWDYAIQPPLAVIVLACAATVTRARRRLTAAVLLGGVGYGCGALFLVEGAPDLALAQFLVESLSLIAFVFVLRRMPDRFAAMGRTAVPRWPRVLIAAAVGVFVGLLALAVGDAHPQWGQASQEYVARSPAQTGARNVVNAIIVDFRAFDTLGEITVLAVAALGIAGLLLARAPGGRLPGSHTQEDDGPNGPGRPGRPGRLNGLDGRGGRHGRDDGGPEDAWLDVGGEFERAHPRGGGQTSTRSVLIEVTARAVFPVVLVFSVYLLFAGHSRTGGGFAGGLVAGLAFVLRYVAGSRDQVGPAVPLRPSLLIGWGLVVATGVALAPVAVGGAVLQSHVTEAHLPMLGHVEVATSQFFDVGVYLVVVGVVLELLRTLGIGIEKEGGLVPGPPAGDLSVGAEPAPRTRPARSLGMPADDLPGPDGPSGLDSAPGADSAPAPGGPPGPDGAP